MATLIWPSSLPQYVAQDSHSYQFGEGRIRSGTDVGPGKTRRQYSSFVKPVTCKLWLTTHQRTVLEHWWDVDTGGGTLPWWFPATGLNGYQMLSTDMTPWVQADESPILISAWWLVQFSLSAGPPEIVPVGVEWNGTMQLEILP